MVHLETDIPHLYKLGAGGKFEMIVGGFVLDEKHLQEKLNETGNHFSLRNIGSETTHLALVDTDSPDDPHSPELPTSPD